jgi:serine/threonine protein kinase
MYKKNGTEMGGLLATYFAIQLGRILEQVHTAANIIHGDVKPDNVVLRVGCIDERMSLEQLLQQQEGTLQLIDWGRSIDMNCFPEGQKFVGCAGTENFDCVEMIVSSEK